MGRSALFMCCAASAALFSGAVAAQPIPTISQYTSMEMSTGQTRIGYGSVNEAWEALSSRDDVKISRDGAWTQIQDFEDAALWSFAPEKDSAYPTVIKRTVVDHGPAVEIVMDGLCESDYKTCESVMRRFQRRNFKYQPVMGTRRPVPGAKADLPALQGLMEMARSRR